MKILQLKPKARLFTITHKSKKLYLKSIKCTHIFTTLKNVINICIYLYFHVSKNKNIKYSLCLWLKIRNIKMLAIIISDVTVTDDFHFPFLFIFCIFFNFLHEHILLWNMFLGIPSNQTPVLFKGTKLISYFSQPLIHTIRKFRKG